MGQHCINLIKLIGGYLVFGSHLGFDAKFWAAPKLISKGMGSG